MTPLAERMVRRIRADGPMTIAAFMAEALGDPEHGYYATRDPLGGAGDFTTAPEISQMFGELVGLALAQAWLDQGAPGDMRLVELGPGRGTLMADVLRATKAVPGFGADVHMVETSPVLRARQAVAVPGVTHHDRMEDVPDGPLYLIANEFFDALPIRQFVRDGGGWRERVVGLRDDRLTFGLSAATPRPELDHRLDDTRDDDLVETCAPALSVAAGIGRRIATSGGAALVIDYGGWRSLGDTLQAVAGHAFADPLDAPGESDLTAHVDFEALARAAAPAAATEMTPQGFWLERLGIRERAEALAARLTGPALDQHIAAHRRLTHPDEMGTLFKVLGLFPRSAPPPPGLTA